MDFEISRKDFTTALKQMLQGRKPESTNLVDMTAGDSMLTVVATGTSIEVPIQAQECGSFSVPISVLFKVKRISGTYHDPAFRVHVADGRFQLQKTSISHPGILARRIARRIVDIPEDALACDVLSLPLIFSVDEIEDCGLHVRVLEAQQRMPEDVDSVYDLLLPYGFDRSEINGLLQSKIAVRAEAMKRILFAKE